MRIDGWTDGRTYMTGLRVAFRNLAIEPKNVSFHAMLAREEKES